MSVDPFKRKRITEIAADCLRRWGAGESFSEESIMEAHSELMPELADELHKIRLIANAASWAERDDPTLSMQERKTCAERCDAERCDAERHVMKRGYFIMLIRTCI